MAAIYLGKTTSASCWTWKRPSEVVEGAFRGLAEEKAANVPRTRGVRRALPCT